MKFNLVRFINILFYLYIPIDCINGVLIRSSGISLSSNFKSFLIFLLSLYFFRKKIYVPLFIFGFFLFFFIIRYLTLYSSLLDFFWGIKFVSIIFSYFYFIERIKNGEFKVIINLAFLSFFIISLNVLLGSFGYGYQQYSREGIGTRGFFFAGNELGILLISTMFIILTFFVRENRHYFFYIFSLLSIVCASFLVTKSAIFGVMILIVILPLIGFNFNFKRLLISKSSLKFFSFAIFSFIIIFPLLIYFVLFELDLMSRLMTYYYKVDLVTVLLSGRDLAFSEVYYYYTESLNFYNFVFGYGFNWLLEMLGHNVELDFIDFFIVLGLIGIIWMCYSLCLIFFNIIKLNKVFFPYKNYVLFFLLLLVVLSSLSGHVFNSGLSGLMIGAALSLAFVPIKI